MSSQDNYPPYTWPDYTELLLNTGFTSDNQPAWNASFDQPLSNGCIAGHYNFHTVSPSTPSAAFVANYDNVGPAGQQDDDVTAPSTHQDRGDIDPRIESSSEAASALWPHEENTGGFTQPSYLQAPQSSFTDPPSLSTEQAEDPFQSFRCENSECRGKIFVSKAGLLRHQREIHGHCNNGRRVQLVFCPVPLCDRSKKGFPRRSNLKEHQKRNHGPNLKDHQKRLHGNCVADLTANSSRSSNLGNQELGMPLSLSSTEGIDRLTMTRGSAHDGNNQMIDLRGQLTVLRRERAQRDENRRILDESIRILDENIGILEKAMQITLPSPA